MRRTSRTIPPRDGWQAPEGVRLFLYANFEEIRKEIERELGYADVALATSYCADGAAASRTLLDSAASIKAFYDLATCWEGLDSFFEFGKEILPVRCTDDVLAALSLSDGELSKIAAAARVRSLEDHSAGKRVLELEAICEAVHTRSTQPALVA